MALLPFRGAIPDGLLYDAEHDMWVRRLGEEALIGATAFGIHRAGEIIGFTAKPKGAEVEAGRCAGAGARGVGVRVCAAFMLGLGAFTYP